MARFDITKNGGIITGFQPSGKNPTPPKSIKSTSFYEEGDKLEKIKSFADNQIQKYVRDPKPDNMWAFGYKAAMIDVIEYIERGCIKQK